MLNNQRISRAQSTLEYTVIIAVVVGALLAMQIYMKRGVQGKLRESTDDIGEQFAAGQTSVTSRTDRTAGTTVQEVSNEATSTFTGSGEKADTRIESGEETVAKW